MKLKNRFAFKAMQFTGLLALFVAYSSIPSYCMTFLYEPKMPKALMDVADNN